MLLVSVIRKRIGYPKIVKISMLGNSCVILCHPENLTRSGAPYLSQEAGDSRHQNTSIRSMPLIDNIYESVRAICLFLRPSFYFNRRLRNEHVSSYSYSKMGNATVTYLPLEKTIRLICATVTMIIRTSFLPNYSRYVIFEIDLVGIYFFVDKRV